MAQQWCYTKDGKSKIGPVSSAALQALVVAGQLQPTDMVLKVGNAKWATASRIKGLFPDTESARMASPPAEANLLGFPPGAVTPPPVRVRTASTAPAADQEVVEAVPISESLAEEQVVEAAATAALHEGDRGLSRQPARLAPNRLPARLPVGRLVTGIGFTASGMVGLLFALAVFLAATAHSPHLGLGEALMKGRDHWIIKEPFYSIVLLFAVAVGLIGLAMGVFGFVLGITALLRAKAVDVNGPSEGSSLDHF